VSVVTAEGPPSLGAVPRRIGGMGRVGGAALAVAAGVAMALQARVNGQLGAALSDGVLAALVSFVVGLLVIVAVAAVTGEARRGVAALRTALRRGELRAWQCLGGLGGALYVASQGLAAGPLGVARFTLALVTGQVVSSLLVDRAGIGPAGPTPVTGWRVAGAAVAVLAVTVSVAGDLGGSATLALAGLPLVAGGAVAWQQAVNGRVRVAAGAVTATTGNFVVGTAALALVAGVRLAARGAPAPLPRTWWLYLGGPLGVSFVLLAALLVRWTGVLLLGLGMVAGQVLGALGLDLLAPTSGERVGAATIAGTALALVAVGLAAYRPRRRPAR
jgi:transporter family-2 protein